MKLAIFLSSTFEHVSIALGPALQSVSFFDEAASEQTGCRIWLYDVTTHAFTPHAVATQFFTPHAFATQLFTRLAVRSALDVGIV